MKLDRVEIFIHDLLIKTPAIRHLIYGVYQRALYIISPKLNSEGNIVRISPNDDKEYFFGYYDKCLWDKTEERILCIRTSSAITSVAPKDKAEIILISTQDGSYEKIAETNSWNVQQGCMLQWLGPDYSKKILFNDFRDGKYCSIILDLKDRTEKVFHRPVYNVSNDGKTALSLDFSRLHRLRPGYGYSNIEEITKNELCPDAPCIWKISLNTGNIEPLLKYADFSSFNPRPEMIGAEQKVNHIMLNPSGNRFMVLHRWINKSMKYTRLVTCNIDGSDMYNLSDDDFVSHCTWKNDSEILSYLRKKNKGKGYYLMQDKTTNYIHLWPELLMDGHPSYSPDGCLVVTDTYPNRHRLQTVYVMSGDVVKKVAKAFSPFKYSGDIRCDLHPRWDRSGNKVCIDATFEGGRGMYIITL
jgi:hypothetical protein